MNDLNAVDFAAANLYLGEDQALFIDVDTTNDDSDIPVANWTVEARFANKRVPLEEVIQHPVVVVTLNYSHITGPPDLDRFSGTLGANDSATKLKAGPVTVEYWRTNANANKMLYRLDCKAFATESHS